MSGRSSLIRTDIVKNTSFEHEFLNEYILRFGEFFPGWGPVTADDDNFITRWMINHGWQIKIQSSKDATMKTSLGTYPLKFPDQCQTPLHSSRPYCLVDLAADYLDDTFPVAIRCRAHLGHPSGVHSDTDRHVCAVISSYGYAGLAYRLHLDVKAREDYSVVLGISGRLLPLLPVLRLLAFTVEDLYSVHILGSHLVRP